MVNGAGGFDKADNVNTAYNGDGPSSYLVPPSYLAAIGADTTCLTQPVVLGIAVGTIGFVILARAGIRAYQKFMQNRADIQKTLDNMPRYLEKGGVNAGEKDIELNILTRSAYQSQMNKFTLSLPKLELGDRDQYLVGNKFNPKASSISLLKEISEKNDELKFIFRELSNLEINHFTRFNSDIVIKIKKISEKIIDLDKYTSVLLLPDIIDKISEILNMAGDILESCNEAMKAGGDRFNPFGASAALTNSNIANAGNNEKLPATGKNKVWKPVGDSTVASKEIVRNAASNSNRNEIFLNDDQKKTLRAAIKNAEKCCDGQGYLDEGPLNIFAQEVVCIFNGRYANHILKTHGSRDRTTAKRTIPQTIKNAIEKLTVPQQDAIQKFLNEEYRLVL